jgi:hypothetical protein
VLVLHWFLDDTRMTALARDNGISLSTAYDYRDEGITVLAARKPSLRNALPAAKAAPATLTSSSTARSSRPTGVAGRTAAELRAAFFSGALACGSALCEVELVTEHGASSHTVREALRALLVSGLVTPGPRHSARVRLLTAQTSGMCSATPGG